MGTISDAHLGYLGPSYDRRMTLSNNPYKMRVHLTTAQSVLSNVSTSARFDTVDWDTIAGWDPANFWWKIPISGYYDVKAKVNFNTGAQAWTSFFISCFIVLQRAAAIIYNSQTNTVAGANVANSVPNNGYDALGADQFYALAGDLAYVNCYQFNSAGVAVNMSGGGFGGAYTYFSLELVSG